MWLWLGSVAAKSLESLMFAFCCAVNSQRSGSRIMIVTSKLNACCAVIVNAECIYAYV